MSNYKLTDIISLEDSIINYENYANPHLLASQDKLAIAYNNLAITFQTQGNFDQAINHFQQALESGHNLSNADIAKLHFNIAMVLAHQGKFQPAIVSLQKAVEIQPYFGAAHFQLSRINYEAWNQLKGYNFTQDWFSRNIQIWEHYLTFFTNKPQINALEIGSWEGRSTCWLLENILTHQSAKITCIDTFAGSIEFENKFSDSYIKSAEQRFDYNIALTGVANKVQKIVGKSQEILRQLPLNNYNIVYIDGSHLASDVLEDTILSWQLVKLGGLIIFDDYDWIFPDQPNQNTSIAIDTFLSIFQPKIELIHKLHQVIVKKIAI